MKTDEKKNQKIKNTKKIFLNKKFFPILFFIIILKILLIREIFYFHELITYLKIIPIKFDKISLIFDNLQNINLINYDFNKKNENMILYQYAIIFPMIYKGNTKNFICKKITIKNFIRFYPGHVNKIINIINTSLKKVSPQALIEQNRIEANKMIIYAFCEHFKNDNLSDLLDDHKIINRMHDFIHKQPTLSSRAFQLALEVSYSKRSFNEATLQDFFKNEFNIRDTFNVNNGVCDQSTIFSALMAKYVVSYYNLNSKDIIVNSTPLYLTKDISPEIKASMEFNKNLTGNSCPDITLKEHPYDFKDSKDIKWNKNQIYLVDNTSFNEQAIIMLNHLEKSLINQLTVNHLMSSECVLYTKDILAIMKNKSTSSAQDIFEKIQKHLLSNQPPKDFRIPLIVPIKKASLEELRVNYSTNEYNNIKLDPGTLTDVKTRKAIASMTEWNPFLRDKVQKAIHSSLSHILPDSSEIL
uniref:ORF20 n=1 Tax=Physarum polycephalum TaxID=5791 RepID=Q9MJ62_PHYPO|nr:hypothetical protein PhpooMp01 [Physarum polycephalum]BAB08100.1 unnamed protein product [Physarum polycephalum]